MGKRNATTEHNGGGPNKRAKLNGHGAAGGGGGVGAGGHHHQHHNGDISSCEISPNLKESPKPEYQLSRDIVNGTILTDLMEKKWRIGKPIGKGSFGEIFLASDDISTPVTSENAKYVVKMEPHSNGPLFVEIHCLLNTAKNTEDDPLPPGMPEYIASGSHYFKDARYRFLVLKRFDRDLHSIIKNRRIDQKSVLIIAVQILEVLEHLHDKGYCHSDIKAENLMISKCTFRKKAIENGKRNSHCDEDTSSDGDGDDDDDDEDDDNDNPSSGLSNEDDSDDGYKTPIKKKKVQYGGSNPVRSCRMKQGKRNSTYQELVKTHYLRPTKKVSYSEYFSDENSKSSEDDTIDAYLTRHKISTMITRNEAKREIHHQQQHNHHNNSQHHHQHHHNHHHQQQQQHHHHNHNNTVTEDRIFLIDFGLASKFIDSNGVHRPFCMDQRRAHDGTLEFTSRDAHMGAHSRRSDMECLGYNLIFWSQGYLPWKDNAAQNQPEKVHWMKEYLMTDVKEMLKHIYGKSVPKYLGEYMQYVGKLSYDDRPDYMKCKRIFQKEFIKLGYNKDRMILNINELIKNSVNVKEEIENNNIFEMKNIKSIMRNLGMLMPFRESNSNRVSPKNLRSKSDKASKKKRKKFSWAEILSQDPDQIARERAEKEFEREKTTETPVIRYTGRPTYAILEIENRLKFKDRLDQLEEQEDGGYGGGGGGGDVLIKGYTKPMMDVIKKRQASILAAIQSEKKEHHLNNSLLSPDSKTTISSNNKVSRQRSKAGLRTVIIPTKRALDYSHELDQRRARRAHKNSEDFTDESSCSSINSLASTNTTGGKTNNSNPIIRNSAAPSSSSCTSSLSDDDSRDAITGVFNGKRSRHPGNHNNNNNNNKRNGIVNRTTAAATGNRRKKKTPQKRNSKVKRKHPYTIARRRRPHVNNHFNEDNNFENNDTDDDDEDEDDNDKEDIDDNNSDSDFIFEDDDTDDELSYDDCDNEDDTDTDIDTDDDYGYVWKKKRASKRKIKRTRTG